LNRAALYEVGRDMMMIAMREGKSYREVKRGRGEEMKGLK
jgi:hypothetical protein